MTPVPRLFIAASLGALAACGSSSTPAPVVYGSQPQYAYGQPAAYQPPRAPYAQPAYGAPAYGAPPYTAPTYSAPPYASQPAREQLYTNTTYTPGSNPARLTPVSQEMLDPPAPEYQRVAQTYPQPPAYQPQPAFQPAYQPQPAAGWVTVQPGDTVYAIARRSGARPQDIIAANGLYPPYALKVGQPIRLPGAPGYAPGSGYNPGSGYAPQPQPQPQPINYPQNTTRIVRMGDTLYSISRSTGVPVQRLADANRLYPPYSLQVGQSLIIPNTRGDAIGYQQPSRNPTSVDVADLARSISYTSPKSPGGQRLFDWPVRGAVISSYGSGAKGRRNDGVNIAAPVGTPVRAAADGEVVYRGSELDGYGNLLLIKHRDGFVSAYAHNDVMLVKKGQKVQQGQVIAKVGQTGAVSEPQLHFEIRQDLKSVDPLAFLQ